MGEAHEARMEIIPADPHPDHDRCPATKSILDDKRGEVLDMLKSSITDSSVIAVLNGEQLKGFRQMLYNLNTVHSIDNFINTCNLSQENCSILLKGLGISSELNPDEQAAEVFNFFLKNEELMIEIEACLKLEETYSECINSREVLNENI